jgi:hypothetical protein
VRRGRTCALALLAFLASNAALANGRFPAAGQIVFDPEDSQNVALRTTFGLLISRDRGETFDFVCESALRLGVEEDPMLAFTASGPLVVATFGGVLTSYDGCSYAFVPELEGQIVLDLARSNGAPDTLVAFRLLGRGGGLYDSGLVRSEDGGRSWTFLPLLPIEYLPITVDIGAHSSRVYLSARRGADDEFDSALLVSSDGGESFETRVIPSTRGQHLAYIAGVHPNDVDRLWVRIDDPDGTVLVETRDAGETFETLFEAQGLLTGFAVAPGGETVAFGGRDDGLWISETDGAVERRSDVGPTCLAWSGDGLWACSDAQVTGFSLGRSSDEGRTFQPLLEFSDLCGTSSCGAESDVGVLCPNDWIGVAPALAAECTGETDAGPGDALHPAARGGCSVVFQGRTGPAERGWWILAFFVALIVFRRRRSVLTPSGASGDRAARARIRVGAVPKSGKRASARDVATRPRQRTAPKGKLRFPSNPLSLRAQRRRLS